MELVDIGVNLTHSSFRQDREAVIDRALQASVTQMIVTGASLAGSLAARELAIQYPGRLYATAGIHPHAARDWRDDTGPALADLAAHPEVVALGEMGLDFNRNYSPTADQERAFEAQLELSVELRLPVFLHERDARQALLRILGRYRDRLGPAVVHCFTGSADDLTAYLEWDLYVGITGWICDERRGLHLRDLIQRIPLERLMLETDAPFLLPRDLLPVPQGRRNEPAFLPHVLNRVATCLELPAETVATATTGNARRFFGLDSLAN
ncbi:MAG: TatD family hydrolase [Gammaproteobacteria bacterium]|nr:TatD family hydrolase [Gammaproteobacteria bacterium]MCP5425821.1 TatD family hydrolase [Gammaproteobacteria bacterium]MCP5458568.1 TatD family hydrolase [Gammaproteobacteria bacterium]